MPKPLVQATGRRKRSIARVRLHPGTGVVTVNKKPVSDFFPSESQVMHATEPLRTVTTSESALLLKTASRMPAGSSDLLNWMS